MPFCAPHRARRSPTIATRIDERPMAISPRVQGGSAVVALTAVRSSLQEEVEETGRRLSVTSGADGTVRLGSSLTRAGTLHGRREVGLRHVEGGAPASSAGSLIGACGGAPARAAYVGAQLAQHVRREAQRDAEQVRRRRASGSRAPSSAGRSRMSADDASRRASQRIGVRGQRRAAWRRSAAAAARPARRAGRGAPATGRRR